MSCVAIIPARGGSVRIPRKNIKAFRGKPIIAYSIQTAMDSGLFAAVIVSTDDDEIALTALKLGALVSWRDPDDGTKGTQEVAGEVLRKMPGIDEACVIYATAPLLCMDDLKAARDAVVRGAQYAMTVANPLADAGAAYWGKADAFRQGAPLLGPNTAMVALPPERVCDINTLDDWSRAEQLFDALRSAAA
jgi:pseudaminic acid cytidylyltransferase